MRLERRSAGDPIALAAEIRALAPGAPSVAPAVEEIIAAVAAEGDAAVARYTALFDEDPPPPQRVGPEELGQALASLDERVRAGLEVAIANVAEVAWSSAGMDHEVTLPQGHSVVLRELPVSRAAIYVPGGRAPYPSTVVMGAVAARSAGVADVVVATPPPVDPVTLAACELIGVTEVHRMGGAQAIAALALGTETVSRVDVIVGPGNLYVQEAKRQLSGRVGIDGFAGPSELVVLFDAPDAGAVRLVAHDLLAQAEHGAGSVVVAVAPSASHLDALEADLRALWSDQEAPFVLVETASLEDALSFANAFAPEHLELIGPGAEQLAPGVTAAGCLFVGWPGATAFGDYVTGSNHVLPTGGSARFASALGPRHFRRTMAEVRIPHDALEALIRAGEPIARAEGFAAHAVSMHARVPDLVENPAP
ncbi:MAG TPA: histidinol dehydrogenase [Solirubrobacteraceae bacterium]|nr:histidinol dehydrogenase [Solirubrobacteraceae bacterium]